MDGGQQLVGGQGLGLRPLVEDLDEVLGGRDGLLAQVVFDDLPQPVAGRFGQVEPYAAAHEGGREVPFAVAGHDHDREVGAADHAAADGDPLAAAAEQDLDLLLVFGQPGELGDLELALLQDDQEVVGQIDVGLVEFVDEQHPGAVVGQGAAERAQAQILADVAGRGGVPGPGAAGGAARRLVFAAQRRLAQPAHGVVAVEGVLEGGAAVDRPAQDVAQAQLLGHGAGQGALPGAGAAGDQQRAVQMQGGVDDGDLVALQEVGGAGARGTGGREAPPGRRGGQVRRAAEDPPVLGPCRRVAGGGVRRAWSGALSGHRCFSSFLAAHGG